MRMMTMAMVNVIVMMTMMMVVEAMMTTTVIKMRMTAMMIMLLTFCQHGGSLMLVRHLLGTVLGTQNTSAAIRPG